MSTFSLKLPGSCLKYMKNFIFFLLLFSSFKNRIFIGITYKFLDSINAKVFFSAYHDVFLEYFIIG